MYRMMLQMKLLLWSLWLPHCTCLWNFNNRIPTGSIPNREDRIETELLSILGSKAVQGRGSKASESTLKALNNLIQHLEESALKNSIRPTKSSLLDGTWKLLYTSSPGTNSPIQRTFTASDKVSVFQVINTAQSRQSFLSKNQPDVSNTVCFGDKVRLRITALASTADTKLVEPRKGDGKIFGLNIFGISSINPPRDPYERIDFAFQEACFEFADYPSLSVPYPVPFKLLGDEAKGWIDVTYLSKSLRISRGNKGTLFILQRVPDDLMYDDPAAALAAATSMTNFQSGQKSKRIRANNLNVTATVDSTAPANVNTKSRTAGLQRSLSALPLPPHVPSTASTAQSTEAKAVCIIFPAQLGVQEDYFDLSANIERRASASLPVRCYTPALKRLDWPIGLLPSALSVDYIKGTLKPSSALSFYFRKIDNVVKEALGDNPRVASIVLVGHSIGGWIARAWLSEWCKDENIKTRVKLLVTLGSPHQGPPVDSAVAPFDQTRGLLTYINSRYPGAFESEVKYMVVAGRSVLGSLPYVVNERKNKNSDYSSIKEGLASQFESALAYGSYFLLCGNGGVTGDGIVPLETSRLENSEFIEVEGAKHTNFIPTLGRSARLPYIWYGSDEVIASWLEPVFNTIKSTSPTAKVSKFAFKIVS